MRIPLLVSLHPTASTGVAVPVVPGPCGQGSTVTAARPKRRTGGIWGYDPLTPAIGEGGRMWDNAPWPHSGEASAAFRNEEHRTGSRGGGGDPSVLDANYPPN